ncbi:MAG: PhoU domain-containing protein [candidate division Zixibacteria bacterium]|nr:PhoU domain-containing protein [candidate division Zixibacteria bacterium]
MFEKFKELFGSENLLDVAFNVTLTMLEFDHKMYNAARVTLRESDTDQLPFDVRKTDRKINRYERQVRRKVLTHLTIAGTHNLAPGLALVSIVIDVERIGDYTKNIVGLATQHKKKLRGNSFETTLQEIETLNDEIFLKVIDILKNQDKKKGREVMQIEESTAKKAESVINSMITAKDKKLDTGDAVCLCLYVRHLKRINAHLTNIASSIVNPFPRIGFREKRSL